MAISSACLTELVCNGTVDEPCPTNARIVVNAPSTLARARAQYEGWVTTTAIACPRCIRFGNAAPVGRTRPAAMPPVLPAAMLMTAPMPVLARAPLQAA
ncbi:hypothetical protein V6N00_13900 [Tersicoccus sp. MR15.9]|uniref:hypothetical protein n=1 Tax=Tersicoccus mangrovi TaxID=3121635 RepID=UPI002FE6C22A